MKARVISFHYTLTNQAGQVLDSSKGEEPMHYLEGSETLIPGLVPVLAAMKAGESKAVDVGPDQAYGARDEKLEVSVPREQVPKKDVKVGDHFQVSLDDEERIVLVSKVSDTEVTLDGNHPLAGQTLHFDLQVMEIRDATEEEVTHGHAHGPGGHHHH
jgi:FKBP-type peptidyl-prolyl cis-trans isomerase SlyD